MMKVEIAVSNEFNLFVIKSRQDFSQHRCQKTCTYGQSGIRRLSACIHCAPAFCQSSSIHNSLRSIKQKRSGDLDASLPYTMISHEKSLSLQKLNIS